MTLRRTASILVVGALATTPAIGAAASFTVAEATSADRQPPDITAGGVDTWFTGMYSPTGNPRGHQMGVGPARTGPWTTAMVFGSGARIVARGPVARRVILGGTGSYLGATGTVRTTKDAGVFTHTVRYTLPPAGTRRTTKLVLVRLGKPVTTARGGPQGVADGRSIDGTVFNPDGTQIGTYRVDSTLVKVYSGGLKEWYLGDFTYALADGTLVAAGPYQRTTGSAPGSASPAGRVIVRGTGAYAGMRGQVVVLPPNADGTATHGFTLIRG